MSYSSEFIDFVATIYGEAGVCSDITKKTVAHSIMNRRGFGEWAKYTSIWGYLKKDYDALTDVTAGVRKVRTEMNSNKISKTTQHIIELVEPIYNGQEEDFTNGVVLYWSPKAQAQKHKESPKNYKYPPQFVNSLTEKIIVKGTENDDMSWHRYRGTSRFFVQFVDKSAKQLVSGKVSVGNKSLKEIPLLKNLQINSQGKIQSILVKTGLAAKFSIDGKTVCDDKNKPILLNADGKNHSAIIVVDSINGGVKTKTDIHNQQPPVSQSTTNEKKAPISSTDELNNTDVNFSLKIIDSENKILPNFSYFLIYKGNDKKHSVDSDGVERNIVATAGEKIYVEISGKDSRQVINTFTVSQGLKEQIVKLDLHGFDIAFYHNNDSKKPITNLNLVQTYRGQTKAKVTNSSGKITVKAMPGFELSYKLRDGTKLGTIKVDKNKQLREIYIEKGLLESASKKLEASSDSNKTEIYSTQKTSNKQQQSTDKTTKRDQKQTTSQDSHPKTIVNDNNNVLISFGKKADSKVVSLKSINILKVAASKSSNKLIVITSTARKPYDQARIMYQNIINKGMKEQRATYKAPGQRVLDVYDQNKGLPKDQVIKLMEKKINELGPSTVSNHLADPSVKNTFDISLGNIINQNGFKSALLANDSVQKVLVENGCFHVEIKQ